MRALTLVLLFVAVSVTAHAAYILLPMDGSQKNHLKAYGVAWHVLEHETDVQQLVNYRGGSYLFSYSKADEALCLEKGVTFETLPDAMAKSILRDVEKGKENTAVVLMQRAPKIAVYAPVNPEVWDDAVMNVLTYAEIPFDVLYDKEVLQGDLSRYDWLHLHHEDFTGQHNRYYSGFRAAQWYIDEVAADEACAKQSGFARVPDMKLAVAWKMKTFISNGGFLFAMCNATETLDIALAANGTDIVAAEIDGDPVDPDFSTKMNFGNCLAFENFRYLPNGGLTMSNVNTYWTRITRKVNEQNDYFTLTAFDVNTQLAQSMLVQNHVSSVKGFWGATAGFDTPYIKKEVSILGINTAASEARYLHGALGKGMWTFYSGHDPEDYMHRFGEPPVDMSTYVTSPGYRLILNNVMFQSIRTQEETHAVFSAYPSPASATFTVNYTLEENAEGTLIIVDASGKTTSSTVLGAGSSSVTVDVSALATGTYLWRIDSGNKVLHTERFAVTH